MTRHPTTSTQASVRWARYMEKLVIVVHCQLGAKARLDAEFGVSDLPLSSLTLTRRERILLAEYNTL